jgi:hypothetical protein
MSSPLLSKLQSRVIRLDVELYRWYIHAYTDARCSKHFRVEYYHLQATAKSKLFSRFYVSNVHDGRIKRARMLYVCINLY